MNFPANYTRRPDVLLFKKSIGHPAALEFLFNLGSRCQVERKLELHLPDEYIGYALGLPEDMNSAPVKSALIKYRMIVPVEGKPDVYAIRVFIENNRGLIANWRNGPLGGRPRRTAIADTPVSHNPDAKHNVAQLAEPAENLAEDVPF